jgi:uncharacterized protein YndB with AHSA1/START domain
MTEELQREIGSRRIPAGEARSAVLRRTYDAPIEDVWDACTVPDRLNRWFLDVSGDLREGGTFSLSANASGEILRCEPPRLLVVSWQYGDRPTDEVELRLSEAEGGTLFELVHATVSGKVEWEGELVDVIPGVGIGWELPLTYSLPLYLRGELPDAPASEWYVPGPEQDAAIERATAAWGELLARSG